MSRPSPATRMGWQQTLAALAAQGYDVNPVDLINAVIRVSREKPRQADAVARRYWGCNVAQLQAVVDAGRVECLAIIVETPYQEVGRALEPPVSRTAALNLVNRGFTRALSMMAIFL
jgi:hypothetical protein